MKHFGTNKEPEYDEPEVMDEVWVRVDGQLIKQDGENNDAETGE